MHWFVKDFESFPGYGCSNGAKFNTYIQRDFYIQLIFYIQWYFYIEIHFYIQRHFYIQWHFYIQRLFYIQILFLYSERHVYIQWNLCMHGIFFKKVSKMLRSFSVEQPCCSSFEVHLQALLRTFLRLLLEKGTPR